MIYGAGGIGGGIGAQLQLAGEEVVAIARGAHLRAIQARGLEVLTPDSRHRVDLRAVGHPGEIEWRGEDVVFLTMKSQDTWQALLDLRRACAPASPTVVCAQNGVVNERMASRVFDRVYSILVHMPATFLEPGRIRVEATPVRGVLDVGRFPRGVDGRVEDLCTVLERAGFSSRPDPRILRFKYGKLLMNLGNAVEALCGFEADLTAITKVLRVEAMTCFDAAGIDFVTARGLRERCEGRYELGEVASAPRQGGSTWQSLARGRRTIETDHLNGEVCLLGTLHGVPTPYNRAVQQLAAEQLAAGSGPGAIPVAEIERRARVLA